MGPAPNTPTGSNPADRATRAGSRLPTLAALAAATVAMSAGGGDALDALVDAQRARPFTPVTDAMLPDPDPADWPNWRRTLDGWGYSPLNQINTQNVHQLQLAWSWGLSPGHQPADAARGERHDVRAESRRRRAGARRRQRRFPLGVQRPRRATARPAHVADAKPRDLRRQVYVATGGRAAHRAQARTGAVAWDHQVADPKLGYTYSSGPIVVKGLIVAGITGCQRYKNDVCFISAHDAQTGKELWRTSTIARPGEPGGDTWGDLPLMFRAGGDAWIPGSYDPGTNLIYWGTAQAKPWTRFARGTDGDALYTNCTLAIDPTTGKIVWYYQHIPGEIARHGRDVRAHPRRPAAADPPCSRWASSAFSGSSIARPARSSARTTCGYQNLLDVDPRTGKATYRPNMMPKPGVELEFCPSSSGFKSLRAMAYHPGHAGLLHPAQSQLRERAPSADVKRVEGGGGIRRRTAHESDASGEPGRHRRIAGDGREDRRHPLAPSHANAAEHRGAHHRRRPGRRRRLGPLSLRLRRGDREDPVSDAAADVGAGLSDHLRGERQAVHRRSGRHRRRSVGDDDPGRAARKKTPPAATRCSSSRCHADRVAASYFRPRYTSSVMGVPCEVVELPSDEHHGEGLVRRRPVPVHRGRRPVGAVAGCEDTDRLALDLPAGHVPIRRTPADPPSVRATWRCAQGTNPGEKVE